MLKHRLAQSLRDAQTYRAWQWNTMLCAAGTYADVKQPSPKARSNDWMQAPNVSRGEERSSFNASKSMPIRTEKFTEAKEALEKKLKRSRTWNLHLAGSDLPKKQVPRPATATTPKGKMK